MWITRTSPVDGVKRTMELDVTDAQIAAWRGGIPAQTAFPHLTCSQREFIMTGIMDDQWDEIFATDIEEDKI